ncbi:MAG: hypothetical protein WCG61_05460 [Chlorobium sp.]
MKRALPVLLSIAWAPMIALVVTAVIGTPLAVLVGWQATLWVSGLLTLLVITLLMRFFSATGKIIRGEEGVTGK